MTSAAQIKLEGLLPSFGSSSGERASAHAMSQIAHRIGERHSACARVEISGLNARNGKCIA